MNGGFSSRDGVCVNRHARENPVTIQKYASLLIAIAPVAPALAEEGGEQIVVTATRVETPVSKVGLSVSVLTADDIARLQAPGLTELLRSVPGLSTTRSGGIGTLSSVFVRGASSDHTVALIDGVKINDPSSTAGGFDFGRLMTGAIERIEVVRGPQSVLWGSQAIGGVVNILTRSAKDGKPSARLQGEYGSHDAIDLNAHASVKAGPLSLSGGASFLRSDGISAFSAARGGGEKDGSRQYGANLNLGVAFTDALSLDLRGWYAQSRTEIDGYAPPAYSFGDTANYNRTREAIGYAGLNWSGLGGRWHNRIGYAITEVLRDEYDPAATPRHQGDSLGRNQRIEAQSSFAIAAGWSIVGGAEREWSRFRQASDYGFGASTDKGRATLTSLYGQLTATPLVGLTVNAGARHDRHTDFGGHTSFAANAAYTPNGGQTVLRASYGEGFKAPSLYQLHSTYGNLALKPESAKSWEVGLAQKLLDGRMQIGVTGFRRTTRNLINLVSCFGNSAPLCTGFYYDNVGVTFAKGIEAEVKLRPVDALAFDFSYSHVQAQDRATGQDLLRRPRTRAYAGMDYTWPCGLNTGASVSLQGESADVDDFGARVQNDGYALADLRLSYPLGAHAELYGRIENLFDTHYETVYSYGQPGRTATAGIRLKL
ncbi:MAG: TonB-dependent receptor [Sphingobium sp.]|nr:TonB-dependent receptor [Sphingobium sp.]MBP6111845.1 TonB-dependent receptor [Sphingobium sp.]MBP8669787.1 TonB-dependent receptor [Sphingobium sp.]MBP9156453.1 TonB-dependent receptor [Sphingobium sp.]